METIIPVVVLAIFSFILIRKFLLSNNDNQKLAFFVVIVSFFTFLDWKCNLLLLLFFAVFLGRIKKFPHKLPFYIYIVFLAYCFFNLLLLSENLFFGLMMIFKLFIPFIFLLFGYNAIRTGEQFKLFAYRVLKVLPLFAILSSYPTSLLSHYISPVMKSWSAGDAELFAVLMGVPLSVFLITRKKKNLILAISCLFPSLTLLRRTVIGGQFVVFSVFLFVKHGIKALTPIVFVIVLSISAVLTIEPLKERTFGGDKGDITGISNAKLISSTEYIGTSGRAYMWELITDRFYVGHEILGSGLGTMKSYLRVNEKTGDTEHFAMLHNDHLHLLIETGIVGLLLLCFFALSIISSLIRNIIIIKEKKSGSYAANFCALASFVSIIFCMFFSNILSQVWEIVVCFMFIGMAMGINERKRIQNKYF